jgi:hypothetical protein
MRILHVSGLEIRWTVSESNLVTIVFVSGMDIEKIDYRIDTITGEIHEMSLVKDKSFVKGCHAVLRRMGFMEKKAVIVGQGLFKKEVNRRFFTQAFLRGKEPNS